MHVHQAVENDFRSILPSDDDVRRMCDGQLFISLTQVCGQDACMRPPALHLAHPGLRMDKGIGLCMTGRPRDLRFVRCRT